MAERRATNKYYPPDWDPTKGSINKHNGSHPLRSRARKIDQGILVVRFEMPFNIWCLGCNNHIGMGVRYNAEKSKIGNYYSSPVYQFRMKCHLCDNHIVIKTDPSKFDYVIMDGGRKQAQSRVDVPTSSLDDKDFEFQTAYEKAEEAKRKLTDSMYKLERNIEDKMTCDANQPNLRDLIRWRSKHEDDFSANQVVRAQFRGQRKSLEQAKERDRRLLNKTSLKISLAKLSPSDTAKAKVIVHEMKSKRSCRAEASRRIEILESRRFITRGVKPSKGSTSSKSRPETTLGSRSNVQKISNF